MKHVVFIIYILALASGIAAFTVFAVSGGKTRRVKSYLAFLGAYSFLIFLLTAGAYLYANLEPGNLPPAMPVYIASILFGIALLDVTVPWFYHELAGIPASRRTKAPVTAAAGISLLSIIPVLLWMSMTLVIIAVILSVTGLIAIASGSLALVVRNYRIIEDEAVKKAIPFILGYFGLTLALGVLDVAASGNLEIRARFPFQGITLPFAYILWNLLSLGFARRSFLSPSQASNPGATDETAGVWKGLTPKEKEVARLIVQGKSNKEIADILGVSFNTARNHIASIFGKAEVKSRTELIAKIIAHPA